MGNASTFCLYSTVKNISGKAHTFGYLPPHGRKLDANEEFTVFGDIKQALQRFERGEARRSFIAFEKDLQDGYIDIVSTPNPILEDDSNPNPTEISKMMRYHNGTLGVTTPCWRTDTSLSAPLG